METLYTDLKEYIKKSGSKNNDRYFFTVLALWVCSQEMLYRESQNKLGINTEIAKILIGIINHSVKSSIKSSLKSILEKHETKFSALSIPNLQRIKFLEKLPSLKLNDWVKTFLNNLLSSKTIEQYALEQTLEFIDILSQKKPSLAFENTDGYWIQMLSTFIERPSEVNKAALALQNRWQEMSELCKALPPLFTSNEALSFEIDKFCEHSRKRLNLAMAEVNNQAHNLYVYLKTTPDSAIARIKVQQKMNAVLAEQASVNTLASLPATAGAGSVLPYDISSAGIKPIFLPAYVLDSNLDWSHLLKKYIQHPLLKLASNEIRQQLLRTEDYRFDRACVGSSSPTRSALDAIADHLIQVLQSRNEREVNLAFRRAQAGNPYSVFNSTGSQELIKVKNNFDESFNFLFCEDLDSSPKDLEDINKTFDALRESVISVLTEYLKYFKDFSEFEASDACKAIHTLLDLITHFHKTFFEPIQLFLKEVGGEKELKRPVPRDCLSLYQSRASSLRTAYQNLLFTKPSYHALNGLVHASPQPAIKELALNMPEDCIFSTLPLSLSTIIEANDASELILKTKGYTPLFDSLSTQAPIELPHIAEWSSTKLPQYTNPKISDTVDTIEKILADSVRIVFSKANLFVHPWAIGLFLSRVVKLIPTVYAKHEQGIIQYFTNIDNFFELESLKHTISLSEAKYEKAMGEYSNTLYIKHFLYQPAVTATMVVYLALHYKRLIVTDSFSHLSLTEITYSILQPLYDFVSRGRKTIEFSDHESKVIYSVTVLIQEIRDTERQVIPLLEDLLHDFKLTYPLKKTSFLYPIITMHFRIKSDEYKNILLEKKLTPHDIATIFADVMKTVSEYNSELAENYQEKFNELKLADKSEVFKVDTISAAKMMIRLCVEKIIAKLLYEAAMTHFAAFLKLNPGSTHGAFNATFSNLFHIDNYMLDKATGELLTIKLQIWDADSTKFLPYEHIRVQSDTLDKLHVAFNECKKAALSAGPWKDYICSKDLMPIDKLEFWKDYVKNSSLLPPEFLEMTTRREQAAKVDTLLAQEKIDRASESGSTLSGITGGRAALSDPKEENGRSNLFTSTPVRLSLMRAPTPVTPNGTAAKETVRTSSRASVEMPCTPPAIARTPNMTSDDKLANLLNDHGLN